MVPRMLDNLISDNQINHSINQVKEEARNL